MNLVIGGKGWNPYWGALLLMGILLVQRPSLGSERRLLQDYQQGRISRVQLITYLGYQLFDRERLPSSYRKEAEVPLKCGTEVVRLLRRYWSELAEEDRRFFAKVLQRPSLPYSYVSPNGLFRLHYSLDGANGVPPGDLNENGVPDFIERAADFLEYSYRVEVDTLGYKAPPWDFGVHGDEIDVYFRNIGAYGYTDFDRQIPDTPENDWTSYITVDNDFVGAGFYSQGLDGLKVTCAHEFFHVIQLGYHYRDEDLFFFEMSSTWMEDRVFTDVNDYYHYLRYYFETADLPLSYTNGFREYGSAVFLKFIQERFGEDLIRRTWELIPQQHSMFSMARAFEEIGTALHDALVEFGVWNCFTGSRKLEGRFYKEGQFYPEIRIDKRLEFQQDTTFTDSTYFLSMKYFEVVPEYSGFFSMVVNSEVGPLWRTGVITGWSSGPFVNYIEGNSRGNLGYIPGLESVLLVVVNPEVPDDIGKMLYKYREKPFTYSILRQRMGKESLVFPNPVVLDGGGEVLITLQMSVSQPGNYDSYLISSQGRIVRTFSPLRLPKGETRVQFSWDGKDNRGQDVPSGVYLFILSSGKERIRAKLAVIRR
jgi:hypothetical protein